MNSTHIFVEFYTYWIFGLNPRKNLQIRLNKKGSCDILIKSSMDTTLKEHSKLSFIWYIHDNDKK